MLSTLSLHKKGLIPDASLNRLIICTNKGQLENQPENNAFVPGSLPDLQVVLFGLKITRLSTPIPAFPSARHHF